jgi:hypothetical protein
MFPSAKSTLSSDSIASVPFHDPYVFGRQRKQKTEFTIDTFSYDYDSKFDTRV